jgi:2-dehydropantoate 2-reductase
MGLDQLLKVFLCTTGMAMCHPFAQRSSMLQDLERGLKTEVDVINGAVVKKGRKYAIETPLNAQIVELVHATERRERHPSREVFNELSLIG